MITKHTLSVGAAIAVFFTGSAFAQQEQAAAEAQAAQPAAEVASAEVDVSDNKLKEFAKVHKEVTTISTSYQGQLQATDDPVKVAEISQEANQEMVKVVEKSPITVEEYNKIAMLLQQDQQLQNKYRKFSE